MSNQGTSKGGAAATTSTSTTPAAPPALVPTPLDCSKANTGVWLVKVPKYLARKWIDAPENSEVGVIRITQSKLPNSPKPKQEVVFHLNEALGQTATLKIGNTTIEQKVPLQHKFVMTPSGTQDVFVLGKSDEPNGKERPIESLSLMGKVMQRAECLPVQNDRSYINLKREVNKQYIEPKRQTKMAENIIKTSFLPKSTYFEKMENKSKNKVKKLRKDKVEVLDMLFNAFTKHQYYNIKDLVKLTQQPSAYLKLILREICVFNVKGAHKNTYELKAEYKQSGQNADVKKRTAAASIEKNVDTNNLDQFMDDEDEDEDEDEDDFDDVDDLDDLEDEPMF